MVAARLHARENPSVLSPERDVSRLRQLLVEIPLAIVRAALSGERRPLRRREQAQPGLGKPTMSTRRTESSTRAARALTCAVAIACTLAGASLANAGPREQAKRMYDRLTGTPPSPALLDELTNRVANDSALDAAMFIIDDAQPHSSPFYSVVLKNFATPWTNRDQTIFAPLNDYTATVIGTVRDDHDFREILWQDRLYVGNVTPAYSPSSNAHYEALESSHADLRLPSVLQERTQSSLNGLPPDATAGVITSRAASEAFFIAGTNRAMFRFTLLNHMCRDLEQVHDTSRPPDRIRQDVSRSPGGDSRIFLNNCVGCHSGMDPLAQAFAYYNFEVGPNDDPATGRLVYTPGVVQPKYLINSDNFKPGYVTPDDSWENRWRLPGQNNESIGWANSDGQIGPNHGMGKGAKSLGQELANSTAFAQCQVEKVFKTVCFRSPSDSELSQVTSAFRNTNGSLKRVFAEAASRCAGP
jgi:hypothetical protein